MYLCTVISLCTRVYRKRTWHSSEDRFCHSRMDRVLAAMFLAEFSTVGIISCLFRVIQASPRLMSMHVSSLDWTRRECPSPSSFWKGSCDLCAYVYCQWRVGSSWFWRPDHRGTPRKPCCPSQAVPVLSAAHFLFIGAIAWLPFACVRTADTCVLWEKVTGGQVWKF